MVLGTVEDMHTPNMGGPRFDYNGQHTDSIQMAPGGMVSADVMLYTSGESAPARRRTRMHWARKCVALLSGTAAAV